MGRFTVIALFMLLSGCATAVKDNAPQTPAEHLDVGKAAFQTQNYATAFEHLFPAATAGFADAQYALGFLYYNGFGTPKDIEMGHMWIRKAAEQGHKKALTALQSISADAQVPTRG